MTALDDRPLLAPAVDEDSSVVGRSRSAQRTSGWSGPLAGAAAFAAVAVLVDLRHGAMTGAITAVLAEVATHRHAGRPIVDVRGRGAGAVAGMAVGAAALATAGAVAADRGGSSLEALGTFALGWVIVLLLVVRGPQVTGTPGEQPVSGVAFAAGAVAVVAAIVAVLTGSGASTAIALLVAAPVAASVFVAATGRDPSATDRVGATATAVVVGALAGIVALLAVPPGGSWALVAALAAATIGALSIGGAVSGGLGIAVPVWTPLAGLLVALVAAGAGAGVAGLAAAGGLLLVDQRDRRATPTRRVVDTSAVTARRIVTGLTVAAVAIRVYAPRGLWLDEATSVHQARLPFGDMLGLIYREDNHPPLHHVLLWLDIRLVGDSELAVRLPAIVLGALLVPVLYVTGRAIFDRRVGVIAAAIGTVAPLAVWYGQEARMYSQFMLLALVAVYAQVRVLRGGGTRWWVVFAVASAALIYTQYFAVLHVAATLVVFAVEMIRRRGTPDVRRLRRGVLASVGAVGVLALPLVPFALHQAVHNQQSGFGFSASGVTNGSPVVPPPSVYGFLTNVQWTVFGYQTDELTTRLVALWPIGLLLILLVLGRPRRTENRSLLLIGGLPIAVVFTASLFAAKSRSLAEVRYFIGAVPIVFLLLAAGLTTVITSRRLQGIAVVALLAAMVGGLALQETSEQNPRLYEYREAMADIRAERRAGDQLAYAPEYLDYVMEYYDPGVPAAPLEDGVPTPIGRVFLVQGSSFADSAEASTNVDGAIAALEARGLRVEARDEYAQMTVWRLG